MRPFALKANPTRNLTTVMSHVLLDAIHFQNQMAAIHENAITIPLTKWLLTGSVRLAGMTAIGPSSIRLHRKFTDVPDVTGMGGMQLGFNAVRLDLVFSDDTHQNTAVSCTLLRIKPPLDDQFEILVEAISLDVADRLAFADQNTITH